MLNILIYLIYHSETCEKMVAYRFLYGDNKLWCKYYNMFLDEVNKNRQKIDLNYKKLKVFKKIK